MRLRPSSTLSFAAALVLLASCAPAPPALPAPVLDPAGAQEVRVGETLEFAVSNIADVVWAVDGITGGDDTVGTIVDGTYTAPDRIPPDAQVTVSATDAAAPARSASAPVTVTAAGTLYVYDYVIYVYPDMDVTEGNTTPARTFDLDGGTFRVYDLVVAPSADAAFISRQDAPVSVVRVDDISSAEGTVDFVAFDSGMYEDPAGLAWDPERDILYALFEGALLAWDDATTASGGATPAREISGASVTFLEDTFDGRLRYDPAHDRLFASTSATGVVAVYDDISTVDGETAPDREIEIDVAVEYLWGLAYDAERDILYVGDQKAGENVYVFDAASTLDGTLAPDRIIGGASNHVLGPSQVSLDAANDRLVVIDTGDDTVKVFDAASTLDGDVAPSRVIGGAALPLDYPYGGYLDPTQ